MSGFVRWLSTILLALLAGAPTVAAASQFPIDPAMAGPRAESIACLGDAIAYEAGLETVEGQQAVAQVVLNRVRDPAFPKTICGVVYQGSARRTGCQFTFTCDGSPRRQLPERMIAATRGIATAALDGVLPDRVGSATFYHADYVSPRWAPRLTRLIQIGAHIFYSAGNGARPGPAARETAIAGPIRAAPSSFAPWGLVVAAAPDHDFPNRTAPTDTQSSR